MSSTHPLPLIARCPSPSPLPAPGVKYPLRWLREVRDRSTPSHRWLTLLDSAAYAPTQPLNLTIAQPDFVDVSFYK